MYHCPKSHHEPVPPPIESLLLYPHVYHDCPIVLTPLPCCFPCFSFWDSCFPFVLWLAQYQDRIASLSVQLAVRWFCFRPWLSLSYWLCWPITKHGCGALPQLSLPLSFSSFVNRPTTQTETTRQLLPTQPPTQSKVEESIRMDGWMNHAIKQRMREGRKEGRKEEWHNSCWNEYCVATGSFRSYGHQSASGIQPQSNHFLEVCQYALL